ncbi:TonB-dependent receptor [Pedobacter steynii]|uniref:TonB-dependent receptor n=1 Tax=Pedobacter steynii TaxID=430522 RepID=A0A1D7QHM8_9SPHI|nr:TonB-dependent receptor [Pedobacter steynii]AOM78175.1 TonB-dependent receptor [Pedobacter steynii]
MYKLLFSLFLLFFSMTLSAQQFSTIKGKITTSDGQAAAYISVGLKNKAQGNLSDESGSYSIPRVKPGNYTLRATAVGSNPIEKAIKVLPGEDLTVDFIITENSGQLKEININSNKTNKYATKRSEYVSKMPLRNLENSQVYSSISKELMADQLSFSIDDATRNAPGLQKMWEATGRGGDGGSYYNLRGFIAQSKLRNGIAGNVTSRIDAANLERIEVIKGPSATLFGNALTSYGGLINRVTKKPYDHIGGEVTYAAGSYDFNRVSVDFNTPLDTAKTLLFRVNAAYNYEGSFQDRGFDKGFVLAPSLSYKANDRLSFLFDAEIFSGKNTGKQIFFFPYQQSVAALGVDRADQLSVDYKKSYFSNDLTQQSRNTNLFGNMEYKFSDSWTSQTNITYTKSYSNGFSPYFYLMPGNLLSREDQSTMNSKMNVLEIQQNFNADFHIGGHRNRFVVGLDFLRINSDQLFYSAKYDELSAGVTSGPAYDSFNRTNMEAVYGKDKTTYPDIYKTNTYSAYISDVFNITDQFMALAAIRVDRFEHKGSYDRQGKQRSEPYKQTQFAPKFGLVYQVLKDQLSLFANYQNGFTNVPGTNFESKALKPEQANQIEGGIKMDLFDGKLSGTLSYYDIKVEDMVRPYQGGTGENSNLKIQDGTQTSKGFEAELVANPAKGLNIIAGFTYNDSKLVKVQDPDVEGLRPGTAASPYTANLWLNYHLPDNFIKGLGFGVGGNYASDNKVLNSRAYGVFILPAYTILNASAFYDHPKFRLGLKVDNLTDKKYWIGYTTVNPQRLRNIIGSLTYKF